MEIKICGITNSEDARLAVDCGATYLGFILVPGSPRCIDLEKAAAIAAGLPDPVKTVAVVADRSVDDLQAMIGRRVFDLLQLHGSETAEDAIRVGLQHVWKAVSLRQPADIETALHYPAKALLVDTMVDGRRGGTGVVGDWHLAAELAQQRPVVLAGGLTPDNVADAVSQVRPVCVDVSSGVEASPGKKDPDAVRMFCRLAGAAGGATDAGHL